MERKNAKKIRNMVVIALFAALAYVAMIAIHIKVGFLTLDVKDAVITLCGLYFGPWGALFISILVPFLEFVTISDTAYYGLIMNILGSVSFSVTASLIYKWKKTFVGAIFAMIGAVFAMTGVMLAANLLITPHFMHTDVETVRGMIPTLLLPFNVLKGLLNVGLVLLLYKHLARVLRRAKVLPAISVQEGEVTPATRRARTVLMVCTAVLLIAVSLIIIFTVMGGKWVFGTTGT